MLDRLPCRQQLQRIGVLDAQADVMCALCHEEMETSVHLMSSCLKVREVWEACNVWLTNLDASNSVPLSVHFLQFSRQGRNNRQRQGELAVWLAVVWSVWLLRNDIVFGSAVFDHEYLLDIIQFRSWNWIRNKLKGVSFSIFEWKTSPVACLHTL